MLPNAVRPTSSPTIEISRRLNSNRRDNDGRSFLTICFSSNCTSHHQPNNTNHNQIELYWEKSHLYSTPSTFTISTWAPTTNQTLWQLPLPTREARKNSWTISWTIGGWQPFSPTLDSWRKIRRNAPLAGNIQRKTNLPISSLMNLQWRKKAPQERNEQTSEHECIATKRTIGGRKDNVPKGLPIVKRDFINCGGNRSLQVLIKCADFHRLLSCERKLDLMAYRQFNLLQRTEEHLWESKTFNCREDHFDQLRQPRTHPQEAELSWCRVQRCTNNRRHETKNYSSDNYESIAYADYILFFLINLNIYVAMVLASISISAAPSVKSMAPLGCFGTRHGSHLWVSFLCNLRGDMDNLNQAP